MNGLESAGDPTVAHLHRVTPIHVGRQDRSQPDVPVAVSVIASAVAYAASGLFVAVPTPSDMAAATGELAVASIALTFFGHAIGLLTRSVPVAWSSHRVDPAG